MRKKLLIIVGLVSIALVLYTGSEISQAFNATSSIDNLPDITNSREVDLNGKSAPDTNLLVIVNGKSKSRIKTNDEGNFSHTVAFEEDGEYEIKIRPVVFGVTIGKISDSHKLMLDTTPPSKDEFEMISDLPFDTEESEVQIEVRINPEDTLIVGDESYSPDNQGLVRLTKGLSPLSVTSIEFKLADRAGNVSEVVHTENVKYNRYYLQFLESDFYKCRVDGPITLFSDSEGNEYDDGKVCLQIAQWEGFVNQINQLPIEGAVGSNITSVTVDGKRIEWDSNGDVFQRIPLMLYGGLNKYKVEIRDDRGNVATGSISTTTERINDGLDITIE